MAISCWRCRLKLASGCRCLSLRGNNSIIVPRSRRRSPGAGERCEGVALMKRLSMCFAVLLKINYLWWRQQHKLLRES